MQVDLRLPEITGVNDHERLQQVQSYLHRTVEQLQWAFNQLDGDARDGYVVVNGRALSSGSGSQGGSSTPKETFNSIKSLIIKSADIIEAYSEKIQAELAGQYVAVSDFGTFQEETNQKIEANSTGIDQVFINVQTISGTVGELTGAVGDVSGAVDELTGTVDGLYDQQIETQAYIRHGLLGYGEDGAPVYGIEVGQSNTIDDVEVFSKFARFTSGRLSFYDANEIEVAYISDYRLYITSAQVEELTVGDYLMDTTDGIAFLWAGGDD